MPVQAVVALVTLVSSLLCAIVSLSNKGIKQRLLAFEHDVRQSLKSTDVKLDRLSESFASIDKKIAVSDQVIAFIKQEVADIKYNCRRNHNENRNQ